MKDYLSIDQISKSLNIPKSTLRYWESQHLYDVVRDTNNYRLYGISDLLYIAEIAFYRNIGIPINEMQDFNKFTILNYEDVLKDANREINQMLDHYKMIQDVVVSKLNHISIIKRLKSLDYIYEDFPFQRIVKFDYDDDDKLKHYVDNPSSYIRCINTKNLEDEVRGIVTDIESNDDILLFEKKDNKKYAVILIEEIPSENYRNNIPDKLEIIHKKHDTGKLYANFLLGENVDGKRIEYLKGYVEII